MLRRLLALLCALACALLLGTGLLASGAAAATQAPTAPVAAPAPAVQAPTAPAPAVQAATAPADGLQASGTVVSLSWSSFTVRTGGRRMSVVRALTAAADVIARGDYPYVYGGGHAQAGTASIGIKGPGYNGRRVGFDCSGSVGAALAGAGVLPAGMPVPNDAGIITELQHAHLIARGVGRGPGAVTFYDPPGVHIFMSINGRFFGTSDGGAGNPSQRNGGAGWLNDGAPDESNPAFRAYHLVASALSTPTIYGPTLTFQIGAGHGLLDGVAVGDSLHVTYSRDRTGRLTAAAIAFSGARTVTGTITAIANDGSSLSISTPSGLTLTLTVAEPRMLDWSDVGDTIQVTYTAGAGGSLEARSIQSAP